MADTSGQDRASGVHSSAAELAATERSGAGRGDRASSEPSSLRAGREGREEFERSESERLDRAFAAGATDEREFQPRDWDAQHGALRLPVTQ